VFQLIVVNNTPKFSALDKRPSFFIENKEKLKFSTVNNKPTYILRFGQQFQLLHF
jgi:hypothetical protein